MARSTASVSPRCSAADVPSQEGQARVRDSGYKSGGDLKGGRRMPAVNDQCRRAHFGQKGANVELIDCASIRLRRLCVVLSRINSA